MSISFSLVEGSLHRPRGGREINEDMPDLAPLHRKRNQEALLNGAPCCRQRHRTFHGGVSRKNKVSHRPEIKHAIIYILFGGKIKVNLSFCSSWSSFGLDTLLSTWWRFCWLAGFPGSHFFFYLALMIYLRLEYETSLTLQLDLFIFKTPHVWRRLLLSVKCVT